MRTIPLFIPKLEIGMVALPVDAAFATDGDIFRILGHHHGAAVTAVCLRVRNGTERASSVQVQMDIVFQKDSRSLVNSRKDMHRASARRCAMVNGGLYRLRVIGSILRRAKIQYRGIIAPHIGGSQAKKTK